MGERKGEKVGERKGKKMGERKGKKVGEGFCAISYSLETNVFLLNSKLQSEH